MTEHPAAPTSPARQLLSLVENLYEDVRSIERREVGEVYKLVAAIEAEARAAARKEVLDRLAMREVSVGPLDAYSKRSVLEVLDSLSTDTREETIDESRRT